MTTLLLVLALAQAPADMGAVAAGTLEGRPGAGETSPLQARVDAARSGDRLVVLPGTYRGDLLIDKSIVLIGEGRPLLIGSGKGSVVRIRAADVVFSGFVIDGLSGGDLGRDASGVHVAAADVRVEDCEIRNSLFGVYLREAHGTHVSRCRIDGIPGRAAGEIGSGIHLWNTNRFAIDDNTIVGTRDGIYVQSSNHGFVRRNHASDLRYGLHYMFSDDNVFEDNTFERGAAGTAVMNSHRIVFRRNRFVRNRGFASVGLLLKTCEDVVAEDNLIADNARGVFLEGSLRNTFRRNVIAMSDEAMVLYDSVRDNVFERNVFVGNLTPLTLVGRRTDTRFSGNFWSDHRAPDLDDDGIADRPYRLSSVFDHLRGNLSAADIFARGPGAVALAAAERAFPVLEAVPVVDAQPLAHAPRLADVPSEAPSGQRADDDRVAAGVLLLFGVGALTLGARSWVRSPSPPVPSAEAA